MGEWLGHLVLSYFPWNLIVSQLGGFSGARLCLAEKCGFVTETFALIFNKRQAIDTNTNQQHLNEEFEKSMNRNSKVQTKLGFSRAR